MTYHRYDKADIADETLMMPVPALSARASALCVAELIGKFEDFLANDTGKQYPWATRFVMGMPLPSWQRPLVCTRAQSVRFISSIWEGIDIGSYLVNDQYELVGPNTYRKFSDILLDGQQRLSAIQAYLLDEFPVPDANGVPRLWSELPRVERRRFGGTHFSRATIKSWDEGELRRAYDLRAFGGTPHTPGQRATLDPTSRRADFESAFACVGSAQAADGAYVDSLHQARWEGFLVGCAQSTEAGI